jgi:hypothetical protein
VSEKRANVFEVTFEKLVGDPSVHLRAITDFLGVAPVPSVDLAEDDPLKRAKLGDKTGVRRFSEISTTPVEAWKSSFASPVRKLWARRYLEWLGDDTLARLGYERKVLLEELATIPVSFGNITQDLLDCHVRLLPLCFARHLEFVRQDRRDGRVRYHWRSQ